MESGIIREAGSEELGSERMRRSEEKWEITERKITMISQLFMLWLAGRQASTNRSFSLPITSVNNEHFYKILPVGENLISFCFT